MQSGRQDAGGHCFDRDGDVAAGEVERRRGDQLPSGWRTCARCLHGTETLTFGQFIDLETGKTLHAEPGRVYDITAASGHVVPEIPAGWFVPVDETMISRPRTCGPWTARANPSRFPQRASRPRASPSSQPPVVPRTSAAEAEEGRRVALGGSPIYPGVLSWLGLARELTAGTPLVPVITHPLEQNDYSPEDMPKFLDDKAIRGGHDGPVLQDPRRRECPVLLRRTRTSSTPTATSSTTCSATCPPPDPASANPATVQLRRHRRRRHLRHPRPAHPPPPYTANATIQIGAGATTEVVVIGSTAASNVVNLAGSRAASAYPLRFTHPAGPTVSTCGTPYTHTWAALNSPLGYGGAYGAQPPTHTLVRRHEHC